MLYFIELVKTPKSFNFKITWALILKNCIDILYKLLGKLKKINILVTTNKLFVSSKSVNLKCRRFILITFSCIASTRVNDVLLFIAHKPALKKILNLLRLFYFEILVNFVICDGPFVV